MPSSTREILERAQMKFKIKRRITVPLFKLVSNVENYFKITSPITLAKPLTGAAAAAAAAKKKIKEPPYLCEVVDLETGDVGQIILPTVLRSELEENYPDNSYVDKCFCIVKFPIQDRDYYGFTITEIEL